MAGEKKFLSTREVARYLDVNEKMVYALVAEKGLPATKVTGKWRFPLHLVENWLENHIINRPEKGPPAFPENLLVIAGSQDILLERAAARFNRDNPEFLVALGNLGSLGGLRALGAGLCAMAGSHLLQEDETDYNFEFARDELSGRLPAAVNFARREQGFLVAPGNPKKIRSGVDLARSGVTVANRPKGTGTRLLLDRELFKVGASAKSVSGYENEFSGHLEAGLEVLSGRADCAVAIRPVAAMLALDFIPLRWERFDLLIEKDRFFDQGVQRFLGFLREPVMERLVRGLPGYDLSLCGRMVYPGAGEDGPP